jgi:hypothetical protein
LDLKGSSSALVQSTIPIYEDVTEENNESIAYNGPFPSLYFNYILQIRRRTSWEEHRLRVFENRLLRRIHHRQNP